MPLLRGCLRGPIRFSCYDMLMTVAPCTLLTIAAVFINLFCCVTMLSLPSFLARFMLRYVARSLLDMLTWSYGVMFAYGLLTVLAEWRRIPRLPAEKVMYLPFFPLFMFSYIPITLTALLVHVEWKPIRHTPFKTSARNPLSPRQSLHGDKGIPRRFRQGIPSACPHQQT